MDNKKHNIDNPEIKNLELENQEFINFTENIIEEEIIFSNNWKEYIESTKDHLVYLKDMLEDDSLNKDKIEKEIEKTEKQLKNYEETYQKSIKFIDELRLTKAQKEFQKDDLERLQKIHKEILTEIIPNQKN